MGSVVKNDAGKLIATWESKSSTCSARFGRIWASTSEGSVVWKL